MGDGILIITDGTDRVNMLGMVKNKAGIHLDKWRPGRLSMKGGGIWHSSPVSDFRSIVDHRWDTIVDTFKYKIAGGCADNVIYYSQEYDRLLIKAIEYWEQGFNTSPVWIEKRGDNESNTSYAIVHGFKLPEDNNPYQEPFSSFIKRRSIQSNMTIAIEHGPWLDSRPGTGNATPAGAMLCNNHILNPSFESWGGGVPTNWSNLNSATVSENNDLTYIRTGGSSVYFNNSSGAYRGLVYTSLGNSETHYIAEIDVYVVSGRAVLALYQVGETPPDGMLVSSSGTGWQTLKASQIGYPSGGALAVMIGTHTDTGGEVYFDDISACRYHGSADWRIERAYPTEQADDAYVRCGDALLSCTYNLINTTSGFLYAGAESIGAGSRGYQCGIRFRDVDVPQGAIIRSAIMRFQYNKGSADDSDGASILIRGEDNSTPAVFSTVGDFNGRTHTDHSVMWDVEMDFTDNQIINSPDIASIVQEIVNRSDWVSGNNMAMYLLNQSSFYEQILQLSSYDDSDPEPELHIVYSIDAPANEKPLAEETIPSFVANKTNQANLTHIFTNISASFSDNLLDAVDNWNIQGPATDDYTVFGISTAFPNNGPFNSLVFNLADFAEDQDGTNNLTWQYWNGAWTTLTPMRDHTDGGIGPLSNSDLGVLSVHWEPPSDWATTSVNGVTGWWVRLYVSSLGSWDSDAIQDVSDTVYTITWPFIEVKGKNIGGDIAALAEMYITNRSDHLNVSKNYGYQRMLVGLRSLSRGEDFNAFINLSDVQQPSHITVATPGANTTFGAVNTAPTGRCASFTHAVGIFVEYAVTVTIASTHISQYFGRYRAYMRVDQSGGGDMSAQLQMNYATNTPEVVVSSLITAEDYAVYDFGEITIPYGSLAADDVYSDFVITIYLEVPSGNYTYFRMYDLILMPIDEAFYDLQKQNNTSDHMGYISSKWTQLNVDSIRSPKRILRSNLQVQETNVVKAIWLRSANRPLMLTPNTGQRYWFMGWDYNLSSPATAEGSCAGTVWLNHVQRYTGMRGNR